MTTILDRIVATKRDEIASASQAIPARDLESQIQQSAQPLDFVAAIRATEHVRLIAEVKKASPSAGLIRADFDPLAIAQSYQRAGAACISVLTDETYFQGSLDYLRDIRRCVNIPLLRKDFIIDRYQLLQARAAGADCVLLIAECLTGQQLKTLYDQALQLGLQALIELYDAENLDAVLDTGCPLIGINNRDLRTFKTDLHHTVRLKAQIPRDRVVVGESGIRGPADVQALGQAGVKGILVGESLMRQPDIELAVRNLLAPPEQSIQTERDPC